MKKQKKSYAQLLKEKLVKLEFSEDIKPKPFNLEQFKKDAAAVKKTFTNEELLSRGISL